MFSLVPFYIINIDESLSQYKKYLSKLHNTTDNTTDNTTSSISSYITKYGYSKLMILLHDNTTDIMYGSIGASCSSILQCLLLSSIHVNTKLTINWSYLILSVLFKTIGYSCGIAGMLKLYLMFPNDTNTKPVILLNAFVCVLIGTTIIIVITTNTNTILLK